MARIRLVLASLTAALLALTLPPATAAPDEPAAAVLPAQPRIMVVGDSISHGFEGDFTWRYRLKKHLANSGTGVDFVGPHTGTNALRRVASDGPPRFDGRYRKGNTFLDSQHLAQWGWQVNQAKEVIADNVARHAPDVLLVELGFNDLTWGVSGPDGTLASMRTFVENARSANPDVSILIGNVPQRTPLPGRPDIPVTIREYNAKLAAAVPQWSTAASPVAMVDVSSRLVPSHDTYDGVHPNVHGEVVIAKAFANRLSSFLHLGPRYGAIPWDLPGDLHPTEKPTLTVAPSGAEITLSWSRVFGASGFRIYQRDATAGQRFVRLAFPVGAQTFTAGYLPPGHRMEFRVEVIRGDYVGAKSNIAGARTPAATSVRAQSAGRSA